MIAKYYERPARLSYWNGCSTGGRQGLMEAQKYPEDFDAIIAGAPANYQTHLHAWDLSVAIPALKDPAAAVPAAKLAMLNKAAIEACDAQRRREGRPHQQSARLQVRPVGARCARVPIPTAA